MIKINLSQNTKQLDLSNLAGMDFSKIKIIPLLIVCGLLYVPDFLLIPMWEEERNVLGQQADAKQGTLSNLKRKVSQSQALETQIKDLKAQEENLGKKLIAVKQAISEKKNPSSILHYIAKNIPVELWIKELSINQDTMTIKGEALDYTSIGNFVSALKSSIFIRDANITSTNSIVRETDKRRIESFEVRFGISRFDQ